MSDTTGTADGTNGGDGLGSEGTIPDNPTGVGIGAGEPSNFEPEEDPEAVPGDDSAGSGGPLPSTGHS